MLLRSGLHKTQFANEERRRYKKHKNKRFSAGRRKQALMLMEKQDLRRQDEPRLDQMRAVNPILTPVSVSSLDKTNKGHILTNKEITQKRMKKTKQT